MKKTVLVTGAGSFCSVNIIKSIKAIGKYRIITTDISPFSAGILRSDKGYVVPKEGSDGAFIRRLLEICEKEKVDLLIPGFDSELPYIVRNKDKFENNGVRVLIGNKTLINIAEDKFETAQFLSKNSFPSLKTYILSEIDTVSLDIKYPVIIKPRRGWGQRGFQIVHTDEDMESVRKRIGESASKYVLQEYIGEEEGEFTKSASVSTDLDILGIICMKRKLIKGSSRNIIIDNYPDLSSQMIEIAKAIASP